MARQADCKSEMGAVSASGVWDAGFCSFFSFFFLPPLLHARLCLRHHPRIRGCAPNFGQSSASLTELPGPTLAHARSPCSSVWPSLPYVCPSPRQVLPNYSGAARCWAAGARRGLTAAAIAISIARPAMADRGARRGPGRAPPGAGRAPGGAEGGRRAASPPSASRPPELAFPPRPSDGGEVGGAVAAP